MCVPFRPALIARAALLSRTMLTGLALLQPGLALAQDLLDPAQNPITAMRARNWVDAQAAAARFADPVAEKLVLYFRLRAPGAATAAEIADFMQRNPDWPAQAMLERRRQEAIALDPDDAAVLAQCTAPPPGSASAAAPIPLARPSIASAMLRCAEALANAGRTAEANEAARQAWITAIDDPATEAAFLRRWAGVASGDDQWARFQRLVWSDPAGAARQIPRLDPPTKVPPRLGLPRNATIRGQKPWLPRCRPRCGTILD